MSAWEMPTEICEIEKSEGWGCSRLGDPLLGVGASNVGLLIPANWRRAPPMFRDPELLLYFCSISLGRNRDGTVV
jgi:hypothetical protein